MEGFPSGQRGQTVNLLSTTSMVRIHLPPPKHKNPNLLPIGNGFGFLIYLNDLKNYYKLIYLFRQ